MLTGKKRLIGSKVMTDEQYVKAQEDLVDRLQTMREAESGSRALIPKATAAGDPNDDVYEQPVSSEQQAAYNEWVQYCRIVKCGRNFPKSYKNEGLLVIGQIRLGIVEERGEDLEASQPFKRCNLADFIDKTGYFDLVKFLAFNEKSFPYIYKLGCCLAALRTNEVGCERFFSIAGYVSNPRRTRLKVHHYESIAMLKRNMQQIYVDEDWVVEQYMALEKSKGWDAMDTHNDQLVVALERELHADELGVSVDTLPNTGGDDDAMDDHVEPIEVDDSSDSDDSSSDSSSSD
jgi:hypothetical protein